MGIDYIARHGQSIAHNPIARKLIMNQAMKAAENGYRANLQAEEYPIGVCRDRYEMNKAIIYTAERILTGPHPIANTYIRKLSEIMIQNIAMDGGYVSAQKSFFNRHG
jgi:hypothetical protein